MTGKIFITWSRLSDLNRRPHPYHGCALPAELSRLNLKMVVEHGFEPW